MNKKHTAQNHVDWLLRQLLDCQYDIHGDNLWKYGGYFERRQLVERIRMLGPDYVGHFLPSDIDEELEKSIHSKRMTRFS